MPMMVMTKLVEETCCVCGTHFAMDEVLRSSFKKDPDKWFYCPNGHRQHYAESVEMKLQAELDQVKADRDWYEKRAKAAREQAEAAERRRAAAQGQVTKIKKRVAGGACPCCKRTFEDLHRHMKSKHPEFAVEEVTV